MIIPVFNGAAHLEACLRALAASSEPPLECIVVDDGSTDGSVAIAEQHGATVISTGARCGPARARNIGAQRAQGEILLFLDADVCVHPDTTELAAWELAWHPELDAVIGSYDRQPDAPGFLSQYRNLMHHFVHHQGKREASTFWAGCGAIRKRVFLDAGGFDETYGAPSIEDIELGYRLARAGRKLALNPAIQVTHLKSWRLGAMLRTDFFYRALPWSELSLRSGTMPNDLNLRISQRISVALVAVLVLLASYLSVAHAAFLPALLITFFLLLSGYCAHASANRSRRAMITMAAGLAIIVVASYLLHAYAVIPAVVAGCAALFARHRYAFHSERHRRWSGLLVGGYFSAVIGFVWVFLPWHPLELVFVLALVLLLILNQQFYTFLAADRGVFFACAAIPFHLLYFASSGLAFSIAAIRHGVKRLPGVWRAAPVEAKRRS